jgi:ABC-2 type transport system ATP-binding protein
MRTAYSGGWAGGRGDGNAIVVAEGLRKNFGRTAALSGLDLQVAEGSVCGMLGPNGAGKTTAVRIFATLIRPDAGYARVAGFDVVRDPARVRSSIGLAGQHAAIDEKLSGRDNLRMFGRLHHLRERESRRRADELLERFGLAGAGSRLAETYSGGMRRRLDLAASLIVAPPVLFLDEPTAGLDPASRSEIWASIRQLVREGATVLLTTQYLDEADHLADGIVVVDRGRVTASGTPEQLKSAIGNRLDVVVHDAADLPGAAAVLAHIRSASPPELAPERRRASVALSGGTLTLTAVVRELDRSGVVVDDVALRQPTLDEVFLRLTGAWDGRQVSGPVAGGAGAARNWEASQR